MCINKISSISPVLKTNNRNVNQEFFEKVLGMKTLLEDGALLSLGDQSKTDRLYLEESPSMRTRKVEGPKRLACLKIRVTNPQEIEWLLARGHQVDRLVTILRPFLVEPAPELLWLPQATSNKRQMNPIPKALSFLPNMYKSFLFLNWFIKQLIN